MNNISVSTEKTRKVAEEAKVWLSWAEWKAQSLNRLCKEQGVTRQPGRITAATVRHGEEAERKVRP